MFAFLFMLLSLAQATTYNAKISFEIPLNPPPAALGDTTYTYVVGNGVVDDTTFSTDIVVTSTWSKLKCHITEDGLPVIAITGNNSTWPTSVPGTNPTCTHTYNGDTFVLTIVLTEGDDHYWLPQKFDWTNGWEIDGPEGYYRTWRPLPVETGGWTYKLGHWPAVKSGNPWDGVWCEVQEVDSGTHHWLIMRALVGTAAPEGTGHCVIQRIGTTNAQVDIDIDELP